MSTHIVLADYADATRSFRAGEDIDASQVDLPELVRGGLAVIATSSTARVARDAYRIQALSNANASLVAMLAAAGVFGGGGSGGGLGVGEFIHADFGTQDESQGRYVGVQGWVDLLAKLATLQIGAAPVVRLAYTTGPFSVPAAGMPVGGWDLRGGWVTSFFGATGAVVLALPAGVKLDNVFGIGGRVGIGEGAVILKISPPAGTGVLEFTALPPGAPWIFTIGGGSFVEHIDDVGALMRGDDSGRTVVLVTSWAQQNSGFGPSLSGPLVEIGITDSAAGVQYGNGGLPDGWLAGGGPSSSLLLIHDDAPNPLTDDVQVWIPAFTGGAGVFPLSYTNGRFVSYDDTQATPGTGAATVQRAFDALKGRLFDDFLSLTGVGSTGWTIGTNGAGSGVFAVNPTPGDGSHPGVVRLATGSNVGGRGMLSRGVTRHTIPTGSADVLFFEALVQVETLADGVNDYFLNIGLSDNVGGGNPVNGIIFRYDFPTAEWLGVLRIGGVDTVVEIGPPVAAGQWTKLRIVYDSVRGLRFLHASPSPGPLVQIGSDISPTTLAPLLASPGFAPSLKIQKQVGTTSRGLLVDYVESHYIVQSR